MRSCLISDFLNRAADGRVGLTYVEAPVNYLADLSVKPVTYNPPAGTGVPRRDGNYQFFKVRVHNARPMRERPVARPAGFHPDARTTPRCATSTTRHELKAAYYARGRGADQARDRRVEGRGVRPHRAHRRPRRRARAAHAGAQRAQRLHREVRPAARARPAAAGRGRGAAEEALRRIQRLAQHRRTIRSR